MKPNPDDYALANKLQSDAMMRVGSSVDTIAAYRIGIDAAARKEEREKIAAALEALVAPRRWLARHEIDQFVAVLRKETP